MRKATTVKPIMWRKWKRKKFPSNVRLVFSFLLSGEDTNLSGLVTYSLDEIGGFTGLSEGAVRKAMDFLENNKRILWDESSDLVLLLRWIRHNPLNSPKLEAGAVNALSAYENHPFHEIAVSLLSGADPDRVSIEYRQGMHTLQGQGFNPIQNHDSGRKDSSKVNALVVLGFLNKTTGKRFSNSKNIEACLKREKCTVEDCKAVIRFKWGEWEGTDMAKHINATTPFRASHFQNYLDESRAGPLPTVTKRAGFDGPDNRAERNRKVMDEKLKEFEDAGDNQSIDGTGCDSQRADECGQDRRLLDGAERLS